MAKAPASATALAVGDHPRGIGLGSALGVESTERVNRLRLQPDMRQHRDAARGEEADGLGHNRAAFELHARAAGLGEDARRIMESLSGAFLIGAEGHVDDHTGFAGAADHRCAMGDHHLHGDRQGAVEAIDHHAEGIADQQ